MGQRGRWLRTGGIHKAACVRWESASRFTLTAGMCGFNQNRPSVSLLQWPCSCAGLWLAGPLPCAQPRGSCQTRRGGTRCGKDTVSPEQMDCSVSTLLRPRQLSVYNDVSETHDALSDIFNATCHYSWVDKCYSYVMSPKEATNEIQIRHICAHFICKGNKIYSSLHLTLQCRRKLFSVSVSDLWFISCYW